MDESFQRALAQQAMARVRPPSVLGKLRAANRIHRLAAGFMISSRNLRPDECDKMSPPMGERGNLTRGGLQGLIRGRDPPRNFQETNKSHVGEKKLRSFPESEFRQEFDRRNCALLSES
jgi:hypothetical protein